MSPECSGSNYWNVIGQSLPSTTCRGLDVPFHKVMSERGLWGKGRSANRRMGQCLNKYSEEDLLQPKALGERNGEQRRVARNHFNVSNPY